MRIASSDRTGRFRAILAALAALATIGAAGAAAAPGRPSKSYTIEQFMATTTIVGASFSPAEDKILFSSNETGVFNAYTIPAAGGTPTALTKSTADTTFAVSYFPKDERILYTRDKGGDENNHLYVREIDGSERDLTPGDKLKAEFAGWSHDGGAFYVLVNDRDPRFFDLWKFDATGYAKTLLYRDEAGLQVGAISDDEKWLAFAKVSSTADTDVLLYDMARKEMTTISAHDGMALYQPMQFDPASKKLYYTTNDGAEFMRVQSYDLATGAKADVERADWDIDFTGFSHNGRYRVSAINVDGRTTIRMYDGRTGAEMALPKVPEGEISSISISRSERKLAFYVNGSRSPNNLHVLDLEKGSVARLTDSMSREIDPDDLVDAQVIRFPSFDGMAIPNILYKPHQATPAAKAPALVWVHGGPGGQTKVGYSALIQYLVNHGYVVLGINNRGSSGYGKSFFTADDRKHGREPLWDCVEAKKYLAALPYVDAEKIGIIGGSYGGYMVLAALAYQPEVFQVGVDIFGVANWVRTLESIPPYWESFRKALYAEIGDPAKDAQMLRDISPVFHADKIRRPLLVLQGANDPRVIKPESDDIVAAVQKSGLPVQYVVFPDEGHGFTKKKNQIEGYGTVLSFLDRYLRGSKPPDAAAAAGR